MAEPERPLLAVVVPTFNEAERLGATLDSLRTQTDPPDRVLVVDGGSSDATTRIAEAGGAEVLVARGCGGGQIAAGVTRATEDIVLIGHGDMRFLPEALAVLRREMAAHPGCPGGCLGHRFDSPRWVYRLMERADRARAVRGTPYGDQAQFFRRGWLCARRVPRSADHGRRRTGAPDSRSGPPDLPRHAGDGIAASLRGARPLARVVGELDVPPGLPPLRVVRVPRHLRTVLPPFVAVCGAVRVGGCCRKRNTERPTRRRGRMRVWYQVGLLADCSRPHRGRLQTE